MRAGFVKASVRTVTNARHVEMRIRSGCTGTHRCARVDASNTIEKREGTPSCPSRGAVERGSTVAENAGEERKKAKDAKRIRGIVRENDNNIGTSYFQNENDEQELVSLRNG